jgi:hypothetical protein
VKRKPKIDLEYITHWLIYFAIVAGIVGGIIQVIRWGGIVESGSIGPTGF